MSFLFPQWLFSKTVGFSSFSNRQLSIIKSYLAREQVELTEVSSIAVSFYIPMSRNTSNWNIMNGFDNGTLTLKQKYGKNIICYNLAAQNGLIISVIWLLPFIILWAVGGVLDEVVRAICLLTVCALFTHFIRQKLYFNRLITLLEARRVG